ncbi:HutD family protein, partial [Phenylobacterium sp. Root700]|uniref:HutD/Ves family protein n=2 Tax=unclassified Phenylobacterium TaxID=2640670 RepID=UPI001F266A70
EGPRPAGHPRLMQILRAADRTPMPWKNGGGVTREVAIWPPTAALDAFDWRISIADVAQGGPFSAFPSVDRVLTVIEGSGIELAVEGLATVMLDAAAAPFAFPGDAACAATLHKGPIRDLNLMVRRGAYVTRVRRVDGPAVTNCTAETTFVLALEATRLNGEHLAPEDAAIFEIGENLNLGGGRLVLAEINPI